MRGENILRENNIGEKHWEGKIFEGKKFTFGGENFFGGKNYFKRKFSWREKFRVLIKSLERYKKTPLILLMFRV